jgi:predicted permease
MPDVLLQDLKWTLRYARRRPLFALAVVATLAVSIAAATTAFGLATAILWRPLPFADESRLVFVWEEVERDGERHPARVTGARHAAWRDTPGVFSSLALFGATGFTLEGPQGATAIHGVRVTAGFFDTLGVRPLLGRTFRPTDEIPGNNRVVILSHALWQQQFAGRRDAVGETLRLSGHLHSIVGIMPALTFPGWPVNPAAVTIDSAVRQLWVPIARTPDVDQSGRAHVFGVVGRLAAGVTEREAIDRLNRTSEATAVDPHRARLLPLRNQFVSDARTPLLALAGTALAVLLIACANLAALFVSAFESRRTELAVRAAIGAGTLRLVRQLALEALLLAGVGAAAGIALTRVALSIVPGLLPTSVPFLTSPELDWRVALFAVGLAAVAAVLLTAWPIAKLMMAAPAPRGLALRPRGLVYRVLVVSQIAVTVALVVAASLLAQSLQSVRQQDTGFTVDDVLVANVGLPSTTPPAPRAIVATETRLLSSLAARPGIRDVAAAYDHPLEANWSEVPLVTGDTTSEERRTPSELRIVSPGYFEALDVALLEGRLLTDADALDASGVAIVNRAFAQALGGAVLGRRLRSGTPQALYGEIARNEFEIVGVVDNERFRGLEQPVAPAFYLSTRQFPQATLSILVRTTGDPLAASADVRATVREVDSRITMERPQALADLLAEQMVARRVTTHVIGGFALAALALAALGMYGLLAVLVSNRTREIGVRLAIGASPSSVARQIMRESVRNASIGIAFGCVLALLAGRLIHNLLVGVSASDPATLATVSTVLLVVAAVAALAPAVRAARLDPVRSLRGDELC